MPFKAMEMDEIPREPMSEVCVVFLEGEKGSRALLTGLLTV